MFCLWLSHRYRGRATFASLTIKQAKGRYGFPILIELRKLGKCISAVADTTIMGDFHTTSMCRFMVATQAALRPLNAAPAATRHRRMQNAVFAMRYKAWES